MADEAEAPPDKIWVCMHCGKTSDNRLSGWDASCVLNARLYFRNLLKLREDGTVEEIIEPTVQEKKKPVAPRIKKAEDK